MKIDIPDLGALFHKIADSKILHTAVAVLLVWGAVQFVVAIGGTLFGFVGGEESRAHTGLRHISDMLTFGGVAVLVIGAALYVMFFTILQRIFLPFYDELRDLTARWREGAKLSQGEGMMALAWAVMTGCTILGTLIAIAMVATPL